MLVFLLAIICASFFLGKYLANQLASPQAAVAYLLNITTTCHTNNRPATECAGESAWRPRLVAPSVDTAVSRFLERTVDLGLRGWRAQMTDADICDAQMHQQIRLLLRDACTRILVRFRRVDLAALVVQRLLPSVLRHIDCCLLARRLIHGGGGSGIGPTDDHTAPISRDVDWDEAVLRLSYSDARVAPPSVDVQYLCCLTERLMALLLADSVDGSQVLQSETARVLVREVLARRVLAHLIEFLASPDSVNRLILALFPTIHWQSCASSLSSPSCPPSQSLASPCVGRCLPATHSPTAADVQAGGDVELLRRWVQPPGGEPPWSSLHVRLAAVLASKQLTYALSQCLRERRAVHLLQFCLAVDEFNAQALSPKQQRQQQLCTADSVELLERARQIHAGFLMPGAAHFVGIDRRLSCRLAEALSRLSAAGGGGLNELSALYEAYERVFERIDSDHMPAFVSGRHYVVEHWCRRLDGGGGSGAAAAIASARTGLAGRWSQLRARTTAVARWGRRLRDVMSVPTVEGRPELIDELAEEMFAESPAELFGDDEDEEDDEEEEVDEPEDDVQEEDQQGDVTVTGRPAVLDDDMSHWTIDMPRVAMDVDSATDRLVIVFVLNVSCNAVGGGGLDTANTWQWTTVRQLAEFYTLERRLVEFHGRLGDVRLPPRQSLLSGTRYTQDFLDERKPAFLSFVRRLLQQPGLQRSQLVRAFLSNNHMSDLSTNTLPTPLLSVDLGISRMIRTVPRRFRKERGQCLDSLLAALLSSTEIATVAPSAGGRHSRSSSASSVRVSMLRHARSGSTGGAAAVSLLHGGVFEAAAAAGCSTAAAAAAVIDGRGPVGDAAPRGRLRADAGLYDYALLLLLRAMQRQTAEFGWLRRWLWRCVVALLCSLRPLVRHAGVDALLERWLRRRLETALTADVACGWLRQAEAAVFGSGDEETQQLRRVNTDDGECIATASCSARSNYHAASAGLPSSAGDQLKSAVLAAVRDNLAEVCGQLLTVGSWRLISEQLVECLQLPAANQLLVCQLLDQVLEQLFPELIECDPLLQQRHT